MKSEYSYYPFYPFGSLQPGRNFNAGDYKFGFQMQEVDNEIEGTGNPVIFKYREHDPRLGRFFSFDPLIIQNQKCTWNSPYQFAGNIPMQAIDLDVEEQKKKTTYDPATEKTTIDDKVYVLQKTFHLK